ncbi:MAG: hypothetical protein O3C43_18685 [Verrucomicrobia bacterium]|nr:hypothetical protein [Verrucomicrobiota bacterium]MDA1068518.1 hypothetical protein [Verrucomicrobiota bacterium]
MTVLCPGLFADHGITGNNFTAIFGEEKQLTGSKGGTTLILSINYHQVITNTVGEGDLVCEGSAGETLGKTIPISYYTRFFKEDGITEAWYTLGPFDSSANGTYSLKLVADQVRSGVGELLFLPAGELIQFVQDINDPMPAVLDVSFDPPLNGEGQLTGPLGFGLVKLFIDFNKDVEVNTIHSQILEITGSGEAEGKSIPYRFYSVDDQQADKITAEYWMGPLDATANGGYSVNLLDGVKGIGTVETTIPAGEIAALTQGITDPLPAVKSTLNFVEVLDAINDITDVQFAQFSIFFNLAVDPDEIDSKDVKVIGDSEGNKDVELLISDGLAGHSTAESHKRLRRPTRA